MQPFLRNMHKLGLNYTIMCTILLYNVQLHVNVQLLAGAVRYM